MSNMDDLMSSFVWEMVCERHTGTIALSTIEAHPDNAGRSEFFSYPIFRTTQPYIWSI